MTITHPNARIRSSNERETVHYNPIKWSFEDPLRPPVSQVSTGSHEYFRSTRFMHDVSLPNYESLRKQGSLVLNPVESTYTETQPLLPCRGQYKYKLPLKWPTREGIGTQINEALVLPYVDLGIPSNDDLNGLIEQSLVGAHAKASGSIAQLLVTAGEFQKTLDMIIGVKKRFADRLISVLRSPSKKKGFKNALTATGDTWLEYRYGWRPFVNDIDNIWEAFNTDFVSTKTYRDHFIVDQVDVNDDLPTSRTMVGAHTMHSKMYCKANTKVKTVVLYRVNPGFLNEVNYRFGLNSVLSTAWELLPFSFVVDWFLTIGDWLTQLENKNMIEVVGACTSTKIYRTGQTYLDKTEVRNVGSSAFAYSSSFPTNLTARTDYKRMINLQLPAFPGLNFKPLKTSHKIDAFFLARQLLG